MGKMISSYEVVDKLIAKLQAMGFEQAKSSVILDRGDWPAITIYGVTIDDVLPTLKKLGYWPMNPVRSMKKKDGTRGVKFSVQTLSKRENTEEDRMPKAFDDQVDAIKKSGKSEDEAYAIATASWEKSHGGKTPAESKKQESISFDEIYSAVEDGTISLDEAAQLCIAENVFDGSKKVGQRKVVKDPHRDQWLVVDSTDHVMWKGDRKECIEWAKLHPGTSKK